MIVILFETFTASIIIIVAVVVVAGVGCAVFVFAGFVFAAFFVMFSFFFTSLGGGGQSAIAENLLLEIKRSGRAFRRCAMDRKKYRNKKKN